MATLAVKIAKKGAFAIFAGQDVDASQKSSERPLVALTPFLTKTNYSYLGGEHHFELREIALDRSDDRGRFHVVIIYVSGRFRPPLPDGYSPVVLLDGEFYGASTGRIDPTDTTTKGVGVVSVRPGDDWLRISVYKKEPLDPLVKELETLKAAKP